MVLFQCFEYLLSLSSTLPDSSPHLHTRFCSGLAAPNTCHTNTPTTDPPAFHLSWKTTRGKCQTGRDHADLKAEDWKPHKRFYFIEHGGQRGQRKDGKGLTDVKYK